MRRNAVVTSWTELVHNQKFPGSRRHLRTSTRMRYSNPQQGTRVKSLGIVGRREQRCLQAGLQHQLVQMPSVRSPVPRVNTASRTASALEPHSCTLTVYGHMLQWKRMETSRKWRLLHLQAMRRAPWATAALVVASTLWEGCETMNVTLRGLEASQGRIVNGNEVSDSDRWERTQYMASDALVPLTVPLPRAAGTRTWSASSVARKAFGATTSAAEPSSAGMLRNRPTTRSGYSHPAPPVSSP